MSRLGPWHTPPRDIDIEPADDGDSDLADRFWLVEGQPDDDFLAAWIHRHNGDEDVSWAVWGPPDGPHQNVNAYERGRAPTIKAAIAAAEAALARFTGDKHA